MYQVLLKEEIRKIELKTLESQHITSFDLMKRAGKRIYEMHKKLYPKDQNYLIFSGIGNNGGDALVFGEEAIKNNHNVFAIVVRDLNELSRSLNYMIDLYHEKNIPFKIVDSKKDFDSAMKQIKNIDTKNRKKSIVTIEDQRFKIKWFSIVWSFLAISNYLYNWISLELINADILISKVIDKLWLSSKNAVDRYDAINILCEQEWLEARSFDIWSEEQDIINKNMIPFEINLDWESAIMVCSDYKNNEFKIYRNNPASLFDQNVKTLSLEELDDMFIDYKIWSTGILFFKKDNIEKEESEEITKEDISEIDSYAREAMRRWMWDWKKHTYYITREEFYSNLMRLIKKRKLK